MTSLALSAVNWLNFNGLANLISNYKNKRARRALERRTFNELSSLTDHDLKDIGIARSDIRAISKGTFYTSFHSSEVEQNENLKGWV